MKIFIIFVIFIAIFIAVDQVQAETNCPKPGEALPCAVQCCEMCKAAQSGNSKPKSKQQFKKPRRFCGCPACLINPTN